MEWPDIFGLLQAFYRGSAHFCFTNDRQCYRIDRKFILGSVKLWFVSEIFRRVQSMRLYRIMIEMRKNKVEGKTEKS